MNPIRVVCAFCRVKFDNPVIEINFGDQSIYYICSGCGKENKIQWRKETKPFPKIRRLN